MTMIDVDTSPLQAAREWRGIGLVAAAMNSGLPVAQAEALEEGDPTAFGSIDEMIAAAVVYGSSIGIGRDEAIALFDRTACRTGAQVVLPDATPAAAAAGRPIAGFSDAVQERSARMSTREAVTIIPLEPLDDEPADEPVDEPAAPDAALPAIPDGPTPEQAVAASGEIHIEDAFGPEAPWERSGYTSELEAWADDLRDEQSDLEGPERVRRTDGLAARIGGGAHAAVERVLGTERADAAAEWTSTRLARIHDAARDGREWLRRSEHATLFVAIGGGAILIALVVALGGAMGGEEPAGPGTADRAATEAPAETAAEAPGATPEAAAPKAAAAPMAPKPMVAPGKLTLDVFNAGSRKGYAREVAAELKAVGYGIGSVTNAKGSYPGATIIHPAGLAREAKVLARRTGISTLQVAPGSTRRITIVVT